MSEKKDESLKKLFDVTGKTAVVTGAAGQLGGQYVRALLASGCCVAALDVFPANKKGALNEIRSGRLLVVKTDITKKKSVEAALKKIGARFGRPEILVNNAALDTPPGAGPSENGPFEVYSEKAWARTLEVNLTGTMVCCQVFGGDMAAKGGGSIINIASVYALHAPDHRIYETPGKKNRFFKPASYGVSKAGVINLTRYLAGYWAKKKVRVNCLTLGGVYNRQSPGFVRRYTDKVPMGRMAAEDEYNAAVLFLASEASSYMTGSNLTIDGGFSCW